MVLVALGVLLLPSWSESGAMYVSDYLTQAAGPWLLPALGMLLVMRRGSLDLSLWAIFGLSAVLTGPALASIFNLHPTGVGALCPCGLPGGHAANQAWIVLAKVVAIGAAIGGVHALAAIWLRRWTFLLTAVTAAVVAWLARPEAPGQAVPAFDLLPWESLSQPALLCGLIYALFMLGALVATRREGKPLVPGQAALPLAYLAAGALAAAGGFCWVWRSGQSPLRVEALGDLRILAGPILAGAVAYRQRGATLTAGLLLLPAMLVATMWRQMVWDMGDWPGHPNLAVLAIMALGAQWAWSVAAARESRAGKAGRAMTILGLCVLAGSVNLSRGLHTVLYVVGSILWLSGMSLAASGGRGKPQITSENAKEAI